MTACAWIIGRALRKMAPQVAPDVAEGPDDHADVPSTRSERVAPLLEGGDVAGAIDFHSETSDAFDLDDGAAGETLAEVLILALRNARRFDQAWRDRANLGPSSAEV